MRSVNSFDIFDTLLARAVPDPLDIYTIIEKTYPYSNFRELRHKAHVQSNNTIDSIYEQFKYLTGESDEAIENLRKYELEIEMKNTIPIVSNISKIKDGDILVSDMYLTHGQIMKLVEHHNINKNITLYVQPDGKSSGRIWGQLLAEYKILSHMGDNIHSDIAMANRHGIETVYTEIYKFTHLESSLVKIDFNLCKLLRTFRLSNPYEEKTVRFNIFSQQIEYNIPLLLFMCKKLAKILLCEHRTTVLFITRDGCLISKIFKFLYPNFTSIDFHSSRIINSAYNEDYVTYVKSIYNKDTCILFDLHGSFKSGRQLFLELFGHLPRIFIFDLAYKEYYYDGMTFISELSNQMIENLNQDVKGTLVNFKDGKDIRMPPDCASSYLQVISNTVKDFINYIYTNKYRDFIVSNDIFDDDLYWIEYYRTVCTIKLELENMIDKTEYTLRKLCDKYKCEMDVLRYEQIVNDVLNNFPSVNITILDLGDDDSRRMVLKDYFSNNASIHTIGDFSSLNKYHIIIDSIDNKTYSPEDLSLCVIKDGFFIEKY
jgi:hypothetical protein